MIEVTNPQMKKSVMTVANAGLNFSADLFINSAVSF